MTLNLVLEDMNFVVLALLSNSLLDQRLHRVVLRQAEG